VRDLPDLSSLACPNCGLRYLHDQRQIIAHHGNDYLVRCACLCGLIATFLLEAHEDKGPPITVEDVFIAHEFLETYSGDVYGLIAKKPVDPK
jgi:uncharacterized Zn finger protein